MRAFDDTGALRDTGAAASGRGGDTLIDSGSLSGLQTKTNSGIAGTFKKLRLEIVLRSSATTQGPLYLSLNSDTTDGNYESRSVEDGVVRSAANRSVAGTPTSSATAGMHAGLILEFINYADTGSWKVINVLGVGTTQSGGTALVNIVGSLVWKNTAAITSITHFNANGDNWASTAFYRLYGVN